MIRKRFVLIALCCMLTLSPWTMAAAADPNTADQIPDGGYGGTVFYDAVGHVVQASELGDQNSVVEMSKTIQQRTGAGGELIENEFAITLKVRTTERLQEIQSDTPDAAVMLVLDVSNSMTDCALCGEKATHENHTGATTVTYYCYAGRTQEYDQHWHWYGGNRGRYDCENCHQTLAEHHAVSQTTGGTCAYVSRLTEAKNAAISFINEFESQTGAQEGDRRMVSLVTFGSNAKNETRRWYDVCTEEGLNAMTSYISNQVEVAHGNSDNGGTNIEGALMMANNIWATSSAVSNIDYRYTILLTDGNPTFYTVNDSDSTEMIYGTSRIGNESTGNSTQRQDVEDVGDEANELRTVNKSELHSICFGNVGDVAVFDSKPFGNWTNANPQTTRDMTVGEWLAAFSNGAYKGEASNLFASFSSVIHRIAMAAQAWRVTDVMGDYIYYDRPEQASGMRNALHATTDTSGKTTLVWDILTSEYSGTQTKPDGTVILEYTCTYYVILDNMDSRYTAGAIIPSNQSATLDYIAKVQTETGGELTWDEEMHTGTFAVPQVFGRAADLSFTKLDASTQNPIANVEFTLSPDSSSLIDPEQAWEIRNARSDANGLVSFTGLPSGHDYILLETDLGDGYAQLGDIIIQVRNGVATSERLANVTGTGLVLYNTPVVETTTADITFKKEFDIGSEIKDSTVEILVERLNDSSGETEFTATVVLTADNDWNVTAENLTPGRYRITETDALHETDYRIDSTIFLARSSATEQEFEGNELVFDLAETEEVTITFENKYTRKVGGLTVTKAFVPNNMELYQDLVVRIDVVDVNAVPDEDGHITPTAQLLLSNANEWTATAENLPTGTYVLHEEIQSGSVPNYTFAYAHYDLSEVTVMEGDAPTVKVTNYYTRDVGSLYIRKTFDGDLSAEEFLDKSATDGIQVEVRAKNDPNFSETVWLGATNNWEGVLSNLPVDDYYMLSELPEAIEGYYFANEWDVNEDGVQIQKDVQNRVNLTNTYTQAQTVHIPVSKLVQGSGAAGERTFAFGIQEISEEVTIGVMDSAGNPISHIDAQGNVSFTLSVNGAAMETATISVNGTAESLSGCSFILFEQADPYEPTMAGKQQAISDGWVYDVTAFPVSVDAHGQEVLYCWTVSIDRVDDIFRWSAVRTDGATAGDSGVVFVNTHTDQPPVPGKLPPATGDKAHPLGYLLASLSALGVAWYVKRRRSAC